MLTLNNITLRRGAKVLMQNVSATINAGQRIGIVGRNGSGKSSLFALILGELETDQGEAQLANGIRITTVRQTIASGPQSALDFVLDGDSELRKLQQQLDTAQANNDAAQLAQLHEKMAAIDGYAAQARAARLLFGLGFAPATHDWPVDDFSGGWRMRLNLAAALMQRGELLLLDEPTNHLDMDAVLWLQGYLASYDGTILVISHDRGFLDALTTHTLHLTGHSAQFYTGNYSAFERQRAEQLVQQQAAFEAQQKRRAEIEKFITRFKAKATKARQAQSRIKQLERMEQVDAAHFDTPFNFSFLTPERTPDHLLRLDQAAVGYNNKPLVSDINFGLASGDRVAILGRNGAGKSTVIKLIAGLLPALHGQREAHRHLKIGYFAQHQLESLDHQASALTHLQRLDPKAKEQNLRDFLGGFDFHGDKALDPIAPFSGGEKARLALACTVYQKPNVLLLDEPTNHLDLDMRHALERALQQYTGAVVMIAHDRHLIDATCDTLWCVADGKLYPFDGDLDDYARWLHKKQSQINTDSPEQKRPATTPAKPALSHAQRKAAQRELQKAERQMKKLESEVAKIDAKLANPSVHADAKQLAKLSSQRNQHTQALEAAELDWLDAAQAIEQDG